jgi:hypothetical protein
VIEREKLRTDGHIGPTGVGNLPRPMERGGCECPMCKRNREILEKRAEGRAEVRSSGQQGRPGYEPR